MFGVREDISCHHTCSFQPCLHANTASERHLHLVVQPSILLTCHVMDNCAQRLAACHGGDAPWLMQVEDNDRQVIVLAERERRAVHHRKAHIESTHVAYLTE